MISRRTALKVIATAGSLIATLRDNLDNIVFATGNYQAEPPEVGELYHGFILLPPDVPIPEIVKPAKLGVPIFCGVAGQETTAITEEVSTIEELANAVDFPIYTLVTDINVIRFSKGILYRHETGEVYSASANYEVYNPETLQWSTQIDIVAIPDFPRPMPMIMGSIGNPGIPVLEVEKVDFLPQPGLLAKPTGGFVAHWIKNDVWYTFYDERGGDRNKLEETLTQLQPLAL